PEEMGRKGVAQQVRVDPAVDSGEAGAFSDDLPDPGGAELFPPFGKKDFTAAVAAHENGALPFEVGCDRLPGRQPDRNDAGFVPFTGDANDTLVEKEILQPRSGQFGGTQSARIEQLQDRPVAPRE